jgi:hypothetical protein
MSCVSPRRRPLPEPLHHPVVHPLLLAVDALGVDLEQDVARAWLAEQLDGRFRPLASLVALLLRCALARSLD